jgi:hypothetical protein
MSRLYSLLPTLYRARDAELGQPLRALLEVMEAQLDRLDADVTRLYDNWFIETCDEWVVPYIGDLLRVRPLQPVAARAFTQRAYVGDTLAYRRRKGTAAMLERLAEDVTGWPARVVEYFQLLATTQFMNHIRPGNLCTPDLRRSDKLELLGGPFEEAAHTAEVRRIAVERGRYNLPDLGIHLWRLQALPVVHAAAARADASEGADLWRLSPLGQDQPLFNPRRTDPDVDVRNREVSVPAPLRLRALYDELEELRKLGAAATHFIDPPAFQIFVDGAAQPIPPEKLLICDLSDWKHHPTVSPFPRKDGSSTVWAAAIDPTLGRLVFPAATPPTQVHASWFYGLSSPIGGGFFDRRDTLSPLGLRTRIAVSGGGAALSSALATWLADPSRPAALFEIVDAERYSLADLPLPAGADLEIRGASTPEPVRPQLFAFPAWNLTLAADAKLRLDGLLISGGPLNVSVTGQAWLTVEQCTLVPGLTLLPDGTPKTPGAASVVVAPSAAPLSLILDRSIVGRLDLTPASDALPETRILQLSECIVDATGGADPALSAGKATIQHATVLGTSRFAILTLASESLFESDVIVERTQEGCVRFCYVTDESIVPRRYRCQPQLAFDDPANAALPRAEIALRMRPVFTSRHFRDPGYGQLARSCPLGLRRGAEDESEMGVFWQLHQPQRESNLRQALEEYLRLGLEAGLFFAT